MTHIDVLVVGAGPAGAVAARVLAGAGHAVMIVDAIKDGGKIGESLPGAARPLLRDLGLLPWLARSEPRPSLGNLSAWGGETVEATDFMRDPHGAGWHLDRNRFDACLRDAAMDAGARIRATRLRKLARNGDVWRAALEDGDVTARWLVDASGRRSICARNMGGGRLYDEPLIALYAWGNSTDTDERTLIESVPCGWWYTAALPGSRRVAALHVMPSDAAAILRDPQGWKILLEQTRHVSGMCRIDATWSRPHGIEATGAFLTQTAGEGWLAVGDSALAFDPLSSQGMFNALYTGLRGAQAVSNALHGDSDGIPRYTEQLRQVRGAYRRHLHMHYQAEIRWAKEPFWQSRMGHA